MGKIKELLTDLMIVIILTVIITGSLLLADYLKTNPIRLGGNFITGKTNMVGSSADAKRLPDMYVMDSSTTTPATEDGGTIYQDVYTEGYDKVILAYQGIAAYATNTIDVRQQISYDNVNYYDIIFATSTSATTTTGFSPTVVSFTVGTSTTTPGMAYNGFDTYGAKYSRFLIKGPDDTDGDNKEYVQAWIEAFLIDPTQ